MITSIYGQEQVIFESISKINSDTNKIENFSVLNFIQGNEFFVVSERTKDLEEEMKKNNILHNENLDFYKKMVMDNLLCEYNNLNSLLEGFERACKNQ